MAARDGPLHEPAYAVVTDIGIGGAICEIVERGFERDEVVASLAKHFEKITEMVCFQIVAVEQDDLRRLVAEKFVGEFFVVVEDAIGVLEKCGNDLLLQRSVARAKRGVINRGKGPILWIDRDRSNAIAAIDEEGFKFLARLEVAANVEKGMTEVADFLATLGEKSSCDGVAADDRFLEILKTNPVERRMGVGVIAEFEAGVEPLIESGDAGVDVAGAHVKLVFVHKAYGGNLLLFECADDACGHVRDFQRGHELGGAGGEIVDGYRDLTVGV